LCNSGGTPDIRATRTGKLGKRRTANHAEASEIKPWLQGLIIALACAGGYYASLSIGFLCDDFGFLLAFDKGEVARIFTDGVFSRPIAITSLWIDWMIAGENAWWFHFVNLLFHFAASAGVAVFARRLLRKPYAGLIAGLVFALHPALPEAVTWVSGRFDVMTGALLIWSLVFYDLSRSNSPGLNLRFTASVILFGLACLSKEQAFIFPVFIIFYEMLRPKENGESNRQGPAYGKTIAFFVLGIILFIVRWKLIGELGGYTQVDITWARIFEILSQVFIKPFEVLFIPFNRAIMDQTGTGYRILTILILLLPLAFATKLKGRIIILLVAGIILNILPTAIYGLRTVPVLQNARFLYVPAMFFAVLISLFFTTGMSGRFQKAANLILIIYLVTSFMLLQQNVYCWKSADEVVTNVISNTDELVENHAGEWGGSIVELVAYNVPGNKLGAWTFQIAFPEMLRLRHGDVLEGVGIEAIHQGSETGTELEGMDGDDSGGKVVWLYIDTEQKFIEYEP